MAIIRPFNALRPAPEHAPEVAAVPYDVVNTEEARALASGNPFSFLHVSRPDIDLPTARQFTATKSTPGRRIILKSLEENARYRAKRRPAFISID